MEAYKIRVQGTPETTERAIRLLDRVFRWRYNVYGSRRIGSGYDAEAQEYYIEVLLIADWMNSPKMVYLFPEYTADGIFHTWNRLTCREHELDDLYISEMTKVEGRA